MGLHQQAGGRTATPSGEYNDAGARLSPPDDPAAFTERLPQACKHLSPAWLHWLRIDEAGGGALQLEVYGDHYDDKPGSVAALLLVEIIRLHQRIDELLQERIDDDKEFTALRVAVEGR